MRVDHGERTQKGVVDKLKGTVIGSWLGLGGESQSQVPQQPHGNYDLAGPSLLVLRFSEKRAFHS